MFNEFTSSYCIYWQIARNALLYVGLVYKPFLILLQHVDNLCDAFRRLSGRADIDNGRTPHIRSGQSLYGRGHCCREHHSLSGQRVWDNSRRGVTNDGLILNKNGQCNVEIILIDQMDDTSGYQYEVVKRSGEVMEGYNEGVMLKREEICPLVIVVELRRCSYKIK